MIIYASRKHAEARETDCGAAHVSLRPIKQALVNAANYFWECHDDTAWMEHGFCLYTVNDLTGEIREHRMDTVNTVSFEISY